MSVTVAARFQTAILFFCIADLANIVYWLKNFRFMIGDWSCLFVAMETWPTTKAPRKIHKKGRWTWRRLEKLVGEICRHDLGSKSFDKIQKKMVTHDLCRVRCACICQNRFIKKYQLVSSSIYNANLFENMNLPVLQACYFGIQYNKVSKLLPKKSLPKFHLPKELFKINTYPNATRWLPNLSGSDVSIFLAIFHQSLQSCYFQVTKVWWHCHLVWQLSFFLDSGWMFWGCLMKFEGKFLELFWRCLYVEGWGKYELGQTKKDCLCVGNMFVRIVVLYLSLRFSVSWYH